jgi:hypothetical protein
LTAGLALALGGQSDKQTVTVVQHASYVEVTSEEMMASADAIFVGQVVSLSPTQWNQDSGEEWNDDAIGGDSGFQIHTVEVEILQPIVDTVDLGKHITLTALGRSPIDGHADHDLWETRQAVFFVVQTELAWRGGGTRPIFELIGAPSHSYFLLADDGLYHDDRPEALAMSLEDIIRLIAQRRGILIQP